MIKKIHEFFRDRYAHVNIQAVDDDDIINLMKQPYMQGLSFEKQMDLLYDYILANQLCEVVE